MNQLEHNLHVNLLLDFYMPLLTDKQQQMMNLYYYQDLSLAEIADQMAISRNTVYDHLNRAIKTMETYEAKLKLIEKYNLRKQLYQTIYERSNQDEIKHLIKRLEELE